MESTARFLVRLQLVALALVEGMLKVLEPGEFGAGRFQRLGLPRPDFLGPFVAGTELVCATLLLAGLWTRAACVPLVAIKLMALLRARLPLLATEGLWRTAYEARVDAATLLAAVAVLLVGPGRWSVDGWLRRAR
jgi:uncharacterized membrane protein YphA (DoxX/SURF4 family)